MRAVPSTLIGSYSLVIEPNANERAWFRRPVEELWVPCAEPDRIGSSGLALEIDGALRSGRAWMRLSSNVSMPPVTLVRPRAPSFPFGPGGYVDSGHVREQCVAALANIRKRFGPAAQIAAIEPARAPRMASLEASEIGVAHDHFADVDMIAIQPGYASTLSLFDALARHGLDYTRVKFIGKSYSTHYGVARALIDRGAHVDFDTLDQSELDDHETIMAKAIRCALDEVRAKIARGEAKRSLLALDDGGMIAEIAHAEYPDLLPRLKVVEQTTRGLRRLDKIAGSGALPFPAARVGSAPLKLYEMPHVGLSAFWEVMRKLANLGETDPQKLTIAVNGLGHVGNAVALAFARRGFKVRAYDPTPPRASLHPNIEVVADREAFLRSADVLLSGTGTAPIRAEDYRLLPNRARVFNVASSNDELDATNAIRSSRIEQNPRPWWSPSWKDDKAEYVRSLPDLLADDEFVLVDTGWVYGEFRGMQLALGQIARSAQRDRVLHFGDKELYLASNGFVVNHLTDCHDPIPASYIQPTRAALFIGCVEVLEPGRANGPFELSSGRQATAEKVYLAEVGTEAVDPKWMPEWIDHVRKPRS